MLQSNGSRNDRIGSQIDHVVDRRSLEVSLGGLGQNLFAQRQIGDSTWQTLVLLLQLLQPLELIGLHPAILLAPAIERHLAHANLADRSSYRRPFSAEYQPDAASA